ncbi:hypothetical protein AVEN_255734-1 [Araneus ventricosus]|uniref:Uncharacterized protein n=1 Tax=Araneus ventricosus TaxID=182803 RepID=A0A4Y2HAY1_ARAVE|nr:hypothetical protein AVEN_255734-1 [Araneus ventricosus]
MEPNDSRSLNWKTCFKKILAPHLLKPSNSEEQNNETDAPYKFLNPVNDSLSSFTYPNDLDKSESVQNDITLQITKESVQIDENSQPFFHGSCLYQDFDFPDGNLNDIGHPAEIEENVASIIAAHAEELAKSLKAFKVTKQKKHSKKTESNRSVPDWNTALKKVFNPKPEPETVKTRNFADSSYSEMLDPSLINPWAFHRLSKKDFQQPENMGKVPEQSCTEDSNNKKHYTRAEKEVLELLRLSRSFKRREKPHMNIFDGAGVNCFKDNETKSSKKNISSNTDKPKNICSPGGWVTVRRFTIEDSMNSPPNIITCKPWDPEDGY